MECQSGDEADHTPLDFEINRDEIGISKSRHISQAL
jgi:hypothetical protein